MSRLKPIFFTSDWHIGHANVIGYSNRPFKDVEHMSRVLVNNYNAAVPKDGLCYFIGDMGLCKDEVLNKVMKQLNGTKVLVLGNHDNNPNSMYNRGFDVVTYGITLLIAKKRVTLSHCPLYGVYREDVSRMERATEGENWHGETKPRMKIFTTKDEGQYHLHGHIHSPNGGKSSKILDRQYDVGVDANNYRPVSISQIESFIALREQHNAT